MASTKTPFELFRDLIKSAQSHILIMGVTPNRLVDLLIQEEMLHPTKNIRVIISDAEIHEPYIPICQPAQLSSLNYLLYRFGTNTHLSVRIITSEYLDIFAIVDDKQAIISTSPNLSMATGETRLISDEHLLTHFRSYFNNTWEIAHEQIPTLLYSSLDKLRDRRTLDSSTIERNKLWNYLISEIAKCPEIMRSLDNRQFEELIAELLIRRGFEITLTPPSRDGGRDILAISNTQFGTNLYLVECKRYKHGNPVGVKDVRALYGVVTDERATKGIIVTSSTFTKPAREFAGRNKYKLSLQDYDDLVRILRSIKKN